MDENGQVSPVQVGRLIERVEQALRNYDELRSMIVSLSTQLAPVPVMQAQMVEFNAKADRIFTTLGEHNRRLNALEKSEVRNGFILKLTGTVLLVSVGLIGWGWRQGTQLYSTDQALDRRMLILEYKLGVTQPTPEGSKE